MVFRTDRGARHHTPYLNALARRPPPTTALQRHRQHAPHHCQRALAAADLGAAKERRLLHQVALLFLRHHGVVTRHEVLISHLNLGEERVHVRGAAPVRYQNQPTQ